MSIGPLRSEMLGPYRARLSLAIQIEESLIDTLAESLSFHRPTMSADDIAKTEDTIRSHRISILKQRAKLGALGLGV